MSRKKSRGKYAIPILLLLLNNELVSIIALIALLCLFLAKIVNEADRRV